MAKRKITMHNWHGSSLLRVMWYRSLQHTAYVKYYVCVFVRRSVLKCRSTVSMVRARRSSVVVRRTKTRANVVGGSLPVRTRKAKDYG